MPSSSEHHAELNSVENPAERIPEIGLQRIKVTAARFAFEKDDEFLVAGEAVEKPRGEARVICLLDRLRRMLVAITHTAHAKAQAQVEMTMVTVRFSDIGA